MILELVGGSLPGVELKQVRTVVLEGRKVWIESEQGVLDVFNYPEYRRVVIHNDDL